jgi:hypothetical protein
MKPVIRAKSPVTMTKKSNERLIKEIEITIRRLDKEGLSDTEIIEFMFAKGVPADQTQALLVRQRSEHRNSLLRDGIGALLFGAALMLIVVMAWTGNLDVQIMRQAVVALMGGATAVVMLVIGLTMIVQSMTIRTRR